MYNLIFYHFFIIPSCQHFVIWVQWQSIIQFCYLRKYHSWCLKSLFLTVYLFSLFNSRNFSKSYALSYDAKISKISFRPEICEKYFLSFPQKIYKLTQLSLSQFVYCLREREEIFFTYFGPIGSLKACQKILGLQKICSISTFESFFFLFIKQF